ncbi:MAG TPA: hypothetical protein VG223_01750 [Solirubrobacteraceae bacterium]|nr:hypothetical protein [Solirubrobacteraceae bacterium]
MGGRQRILSVALAVCALLCVLSARAFASDTESSVMIDDNQLIYSTTSHTISVLEQMKDLGVDDVKVSVVWSLIAPDPNSRHEPNFDATDPAAYPAGAWARYDLIAREAAKLGMGVYFQLQGPDPAWAREAGPSQGPALGHYPYPTDWKQFVEAVGERYNGSYVTGSGSSSPSSTGQPISVLGIPLTLGSSTPSSDPSTAIPRVSNWEIWNEPNERSWLNPWYRTKGRRKLYTQPLEYRNIADEAWSALQSTGHAGDTILLGETANQGVLDPIPFVRDLYCVGSNNLPLHGGAASAVGCPTAGAPSSFVAANPGLFDASGYAHHPYAFDVAPNRAYPQHYFVTLQNLSSFERLLTQIYAGYGRYPAGGVPIYLTEWGYESNPPNPFVHTSLSQQETYLNEGEYMTWQDPYVRTLAQFELVDDGPKPNTTPGTRAYWSTFQTGLEFSNGTHKPSYDAWEVPIWVPRARHGSNVTVWAQLRPAGHSTVQYAILQYAQGNSTNYRTLQEVSTTSSEGFLVTHASIPAAGSVRIAFLDPYTGDVTYSRTVTIS